MKYSQITISTNTATSELVAYFLQECCMDGVSIYDRKDFDNASWDYADESATDVYGDEVLVKGYCNNEDVQSALDYLKGALCSLTDAGSLEISVEEVDGEMWLNNWKKTFRPMTIGGIVVCPRWLTPDDSQKGLPVLYLDSGTAFGTGQHETTSMCIKLIDEADVCGHEVLDVGCGSGILGLSALLKGASHAVFTDIDSQATEATLENARLNGLEDRCEIICGDLAKDVKGRFPVVFANLTADILYLLAEGIGSVTLPGGRLVLSGILNDRADKVEQAFARQGFTRIKSTTEGEWTALLLKRL